MPEDAPSTDVYFNQSCPVCGRTVRIRVQLLGRRVYCQHCGGGFTALDASLRDKPTVHDRVDELLARARRQLERSACGADEPPVT